MNNRELGYELGKRAREERRITSEILNLINLALERRAYLEHGFSSMFDWLVKGFGYSHAAAFRRIEAARFIKSVPTASEKLQAGEVNLTTLSKAQTAIRAQEKFTGELVSLDIKTKIIEKIENKSTQVAEQILCAMLPNYASGVTEERQLVVDENTIRHSLNFSKEMSENLKRSKDLLSHKFPNATDAEIVGFALQFLLEKLDPLRKSTSAAASRRVTRAQVLKSSQGGCSYRDPVTGHICGSHYQLQIDHILPKALGGTDEAKNLRPLCRSHNLYAAEQILGKTQMDRFRKSTG